MRRGAALPAQIDGVIGPRSCVEDGGAPQEALARSSPGLSGTMTPSRETEAVALHIPVCPRASRMLPIASTPMPQHSQGQAV